MSSPSKAQALRPDPDGLFLRQIQGILRLELKKSLFSRRALGLYFLAFGPVFLVGLWAFAVWAEFPGFEVDGPDQTAIAVLFRLYLRFSIYLSALLMFMSLFRNEILERSLHYYFLTPVKREVLVAGKYLSALLAAWSAFFLGTVGLYVMNTIPWGLSALARHLFQGPGFGNMMAYVLVALLGVAGYGAVFMLAGLFFKNPVVPAVVVFGWEFFNPLLPATLKKLSVVFYLQSFYPVPQQEAPGLLEIFRVLADPPPAWLSVIGLVVFTGLVILAAGWRTRRMEVAYGDD